MANTEKKLTKASRNYLLNLFTFLPFVFLLASGLIVLRYHSGTDYRELTFGLNGEVWLQIHRITELFIIPLIIIHLWMHKRWVIRLVTMKTKGKFSGNTVTLFFIFFACAITAWLAWLVLGDSKLGEALRDVHSKLGLLLIVFFVIHLSNHWKWLKTMTRKVFGKKKGH